jgi:hypothetical protein
VRERVRTELDRRDEAVLWIADDLPTGLDAARLDAWRCPTTVVHEILTIQSPAAQRCDARRGAAGDRVTVADVGAR